MMRRMFGGLATDGAKERALRSVRGLVWLLLVLSAPAFAAAPDCPTIGVAPTTLADGVVGTAYSDTFTATTGNPPTPFTPNAFTVDVGTLPDGLLLNAATGDLSGTPTATGTFDFAIGASDAAGCSGGRYYRITIACGSFAIAPPPHATVGTAYDEFLSASGGSPPYTFALNASSPPLPAALVLAGDGHITGTPQSGTGASYDLLVDVSDGGACTGAPVPVTFVVDEAPAITSANAASFTVGTAGSFTVTATGYPDPALTESGALPSGVTFNTLTGLLSGTPAAGTGGTYPITFMATNGIGTPASQSFMLTVDEAPAITSAATATFTVGSAGTFTVTATGFPAPTLAETGALPSGITFDPATGILGGTPAAGSGGTYPITFTADNGIGTPATQSFTLNIVDGPAFTSANTTTFTVGTAGTFTVTASGSPAPTITLTTGALPTGVTFDSGTGVLAGTPAAGTGGSYALVFTADNGVGTAATQNFTLIVDEAPAITSASATTFTVGTAGTFTVTASGYPAPALSVAGALPSGITFDPATGVLAGTPAAGTGGAHALVFTADNGIGTAATQNFTLTIEQGPAITSANATAFEVGVAGSFTVTATGFPAPTLAESGALPGGVTFDPATGLLAGTPAAGTSGTYPITFTATNGIGTPATQNFTLTVNEAPAITSPATATFTIGAANSFTVTATGFPTPTLGESGALPAGVTFDPATGLLAGTPAVGTGGTYPIVFTATNGIGTPATQNFTLVVNQPPAITSAAATTFVVGTPGSFTVTATGFPTPTLGESGALPAGVTFNPGTGLLSGTPAAGTGGTYPIVFTATNGVGTPASQNFTLTVNEAPEITSLDNASFPIGAASSFNITSTGFPTPTLGETGALPSGVTFVDNGDGTGALAGTPGAGTAGIYPLTLGADNGVGTAASQSFTLTVSCPVITVNGTLPDGSYQTAYGPQTFTQTGGAPAIAWSATGLPAALTIGAGNGQVSGTPTTTTSGTDVTITATDAFECTGSLTVTGFAVRPVAADDAYTGFGNTEIFVGAAPPATPYVASGTLLTSNDAGPAPIVPAVLVPPAHGAVSAFSAGSFVYTPTAGYSGLDSFTYTITDNNGVTSLPATVSISLGTRIWFVNGANASNGDGRSHNPFNTLASASTAHLAGDVVFVHSGASATTTPGAITLKANSTLWGQGALLPLALQNIAPTTKPILTGTVTLGGSNAIVSSVDLSTAAATGLTNTGTVSGITIQNGVTVATTTGTAVALTNASGTFAFRSVSSAGAAHGMNLASVGGSVSIAGDGGATSNGSGGTIASSTAEGILYAGGGASIDLHQINVTNSGTASGGASGATGSGIRVTGANGFALDRANVTDTGGGGLDEGIALTNTGGALAITNSQVTGSPHNGIVVDNNNVNIASFTLTGTTISNQPNDGATHFGNDGVLFIARGTTAVTTATIQGNTFSGIYATALQAQTGDGANIQAMAIGGVQANAFTGNNIALDLDQDVASSFTFSVVGNTMNNHRSHAINVFTSSTAVGGTLRGRIDGNTIGTSGVVDSGSAIGNGMRLNINGQTDAALTVSNNTINEVPNARGIEMIGRLGTANARFKATGNVVTRPTGTNQDIGCGPGVPCPLASVWLSSLNGRAVCSIVSGNTAYDPTSWALGGEGAFVLVNNASTMNLEGTAGSAAAEITNTNTVTNSTAAPVVTSGTISVVSPGNCGTFP